MLGALLAFAFPAETTFSLSFDGKTLVPEQALGSKTPPKNLIAGVDSFVPGWNGKDAFLPKGPENLLFSADRNIPWAEGTVSFYFKPVHWPKEKPARLLHLYGPGKDPKQYVIFFFYKPKDREDILTRIYTASETGKNTVVLTIPGASLKSGAWQRYDLAWNASLARVYLEGELVEEKSMTAEFAALAQAPRSWCSLMVAPVIASEGDDWAVKTAIDDLEIRRGALNGSDIKASFMAQRANPAPTIQRDAVRLANADVELRFSEAAGGFSCTGIERLSGTKDRFIFPRVDRSPLFQVEFQQATGDESAFLDSLSDGEKSATLSTNARGEREALFRFRKLALPDGGGKVDVTARVVLPARGAESRWTLEVNNDSTRWGAWAVRYPILKSVSPPETSDLMLPTGNWGGTLYRKRAVDKSISYPSTDCPIPFVTWTRGGASLYLGAHDPLAWGKTFSVTRDNDFDLQTLAEDMGQPGKARVSPSPVVLSVGPGDWWSSAKRYRAWALAEAPWTRRGPMENSRASLSHFYEVGPWLIFGWRDITNARDLLFNAQEAFKSAVGFHWYVWHESSFDYNYPELVPKAGFAEAVRAIDARGNLVMPYINGHLWDESLPSYAAMKPWANKRKNGEVIEESWGTPKHALATMCPATRAYQDALVDYVGNMVRTSGIRCLYIDQIGAHRPDRCFDAGHGHPLGSGSWWMEGYRKMLSRIRAAHPGLALTTENTQEIYMDNMDGFLTWNGTYSEDVPVLPAVYSGYASYFASTSDQKDDLDAFVAAQSRAILWGVQPGWLGIWIFEKPEKQAEKLAHLAGLSRLRVAAGKFLIYGELLG
ncbi:MAG: hypothetical protein J0L75_21665, partial [Spirochaetes bacterium]|nr:hypothetical protein [Spirochaetota bacterium]